MSERVRLTPNEAIAEVVPGDTIHVFSQGEGGILIGADWSRASIVEAFASSRFIERAGPQAEAMGHGIAFEAYNCWWFAQTRIRP